MAIIFLCHFKIEKQKNKSYLVIMYPIVNLKPEVSAFGKILYATFSLVMIALLFQFKKEEIIKKQRKWFLCVCRCWFLEKKIFVSKKKIATLFLIICMTRFFSFHCSFLNFKGSRFPPPPPHTHNFQRIHASKKAQNLFTHSKAILKCRWFLKAK